MTTIRPDWTGAVCRSYDPELWFDDDDEQREEAKALCAVCPVVEACRTWGIETRQEAGVWGGVDEHQRRALFRRRQRAAAASSWCVEAGCDKYARTLGMCQSHYKRHIDRGAVAVAS